MSRTMSHWIRAARIGRPALGWAVPRYRPNGTVCGHGRLATVYHRPRQPKFRFRIRRYRSGIAARAVGSIRRRDPSVALSVCPRATRSADGARRSHHQSGEPRRQRPLHWLSVDALLSVSSNLYALPALAKQVRRYADLDGKTIGYVRGSAYFEPFDSDLRLHKDGVLNENQLPGKLLKGRNQLFIGSDCQVDYALREQGLSDKIVPTRYRPEQTVDLHIGYSKAAGIDAEVALLDKALATMVAEGWVARLINSYLPPPAVTLPSSPSATSQP